MQKPNGYDEVQVGGDYIPVNLGGHLAVIKGFEVTQSKTGKEMVKFIIDFDKKDAQPEYFMASYKADDRADKKWPNQGTQYTLTSDQDGKCSKSFKSFIQAFTKSNKLDDIVWTDDNAVFAKQFVGKKIGVVFGENEEEYNGEIKTRRKIRYFCEYDKALSAQVPDKKFLNNYSAPAKAATSSDGFMSVPEGTEEEIPF